MATAGPARVCPTSAARRRARSRRSAKNCSPAASTGSAAKKASPNRRGNSSGTQEEARPPCRNRTHNGALWAKPQPAGRGTTGASRGVPCRSSPEGGSLILENSGGSMYPRGSGRGPAGRLGPARHSNILGIPKGDSASVPTLAGKGTRCCNAQTLQPLRLRRL